MNKLQFPVEQRQPTKPPQQLEWRVRGLRGATTVSENSAAAIAVAVTELLDVLLRENSFLPTDIISVIFSVTPDLNAVFPAAIARQRPGWEYISLLDVQHMEVVNSLQRCIRVLIQVNSTLPQKALRPVYLRQAAKLRPDLALAN